MNFRSYFFKNERIVRVIYSEQSINPRKNKLKSNFFHFKLEASGKYELSCSRFDAQPIECARKIGKHYADPIFKREYYGLGCTQVSYIQKFNGKYTLAFTPHLRKRPFNFFHCDIYDEAGHSSQLGIALSAEENYRKDLFKTIWEPYDDRNDKLEKKNVKPPVTLIPHV